MTGVVPAAQPGRYSGAPRPVVVARGLTKRFDGQSVVQGLGFHIESGRCVGFLGPNGAGKTTTLRMILGLSPISAGLLEVFGERMPGAGSRVRRRIGVVPQTDNLDPDFTVVENLRVYASYFGIGRQTVERRIEELLDFVTLRDRAGAKTETLSGGMKRRLAFVRALINDPELIILDEPTTGLDPQVRHLLWSRMRELVHRGKTLVLTTHYMEEAERLCDHLMILDHGRALDSGSPRALIRRHVEPEVLEIRGLGTGMCSVLRDRYTCRLETVGDTHFCYSQRLRPIIALLEQSANLTYLHRPANLEDVFLKLTGRELRD